jgi:hypothetical protein
MFDEYLDVEPVGDHMPTMAEASHRRGTALEGLGRTLEAHRAYRRSLRLDPDYEPAEDAIDALGEY